MKLALLSFLQAHPIAKPTFQGACLEGERRPKAAETSAVRDGDHQDFGGINLRSKAIRAS